MRVNPKKFRSGILMAPPPIPKSPLARPETNPTIPASNSKVVSKFLIHPLFIVKRGILFYKDWDVGCEVSVYSTEYLLTKINNYFPVFVSRLF